LAVGRAEPARGQDEAKPFHKTTYRVFDFHHHCDAPSLEAIEANLDVFDELGIEKLAVLDGGWTGGNLLPWLEIGKKYPDRLALFGNIDFSQVDAPTFSQDIVSELDAQHRLGVRAAKIYKSLGLFVRGKNGKLLAIDDPRLDPYWEKCGQLGMPVLIHTADPREYFFPRTYNSFHYGIPDRTIRPKDKHVPRWEEFGKPEYWKNPRMPAFDELMRQRNHVLEKHPHTIFVGAHMGNLTFDLQQLAETLDKHPNFYVECSARLRILGRLNPQAVRDFFIKYQDRILYGSDFTSLMNTDPKDAQAVARWKAFAKRLYSRYFEYFETDHTDIVEPFSHQRHWLRLAGVQLPKAVLEKFYFGNAAKIMPGLDHARQAARSSGDPRVKITPPQGGQARAGRREAGRTRDAPLEKEQKNDGRTQDATERPAKSWTGRMAVVERAARAEELTHYPVDQTRAGVNPPGFCWTPHDQAASYRLEVHRADRSTGTVLVAGGLTSTVFPPTRKLAAGAYQWQVVYQDREGNAYGRSKTRTFDVDDKTPVLIMPDVARLRERLAALRPRLFLTAGRLDQIRAAIRRGEVPQWDYFLAAADAALEEGPYDQPAGYPNGEFIVKDWRRIYRPAKVGSAHLARTALAYKITGEKKYLEGARRWMMNLASWDPTGIISHDVPQADGSEGNDEGSMPVLERMAFAWDWIGDELTPQERARVLAVIPERGNQVLRKLRKQDFLSHPFENHEGRVLAFLGNASLSFLGDVPEADEWLDYVLRCYLTSFPGWGGDGGGWAQGTSYWGAYVYWLSTFAESLRNVSDVDLLRRPFYRNNGYFPLYFLPPYAPMGAFGDGGSAKPSLHEKMLVDYWAEVFRDPVLKWYAQSIVSPAPPKLTDAGESRQWNEWFLEDVISVLRAGREQIEARPPDGGPAARCLPNIGWAAMHSAFGSPERDAWVLFKSSRFGSFSHSHADQNTFQFHAFGEALAIDSGYYPSYGSPHHVLWTRQTRAHNGILINGRGQPVFNWNASGKIDAFRRDGIIMLVRGQAGHAYNLPMDQDVVDLWKEHLEQPLPPRDPQVESFERTLALVASPTRPVLIVYDQVVTDGPASYDWLLHALHRMETDASTGSVTIRSGKACLAVQLMATQPFTLSQFDGFPVPPRGRAAGSPPQWHLAAHTTNKTDRVKFLAVLVPYRADEAAPEIKRVTRENTAGFQVGPTRVAAWWGPGSEGEVAVGGLKRRGRLVVQASDGAQTQTVVDK